MDTIVLDFLAFRTIAKLKNFLPTRNMKCIFLTFQIVVVTRFEVEAIKVTHNFKLTEDTRRKINFCLLI